MKKAGTLNWAVAAVLAAAGFANAVTVDLAAPWKRVSDADGAVAKQASALEGSARTDSGEVDPVKLFEALVAEMGRKNSLRIALYLLTVYPDAAEELAVAAAKADPANGRRIAHTLALAGIDFGLEKAQVSALLHAVAKTVPPHRESILAVMEKPEAPPSPADLLGGEPNAKTFGKLSKKQQLAALQKVLTEAEEQCLTDYFNNPGGNAASKYATLDGACKDVIEALVGENIPPGQDVSDVIFQIFNDADDLPDFLADIDAAFGSP